ncbi:unnamed protein product [Somion occarium]|uniref:DUF6534 domain-containing protein n=1 Tax=Somion occarium TaxID=3059160 RepID=A0ABP1D774_9APHY
MDEARIRLSPGRLLNGFLAELLLAGILYGVITMQFYMYTARCGHDRRYIRTIVMVLWLLETIHTGLIVRVTYYYTVVAIEDPSVLLQIDWSVGLVLWAEICIVALVQSFYIRRIWILSEGWVLLTAIATFLFVSRIGFLSLSAYHMFRYPTWAAFQENAHSNVFVETGVALSVAVDFVVASSMIYYLRHAMSSQEGRTSKMNGVLYSLMAYSLHSGLATTGVSLAIALTYAFLKGSLVYAGLAAIVSKLYTNSLLGMLNAREALRSRISGTAVEINADALERC